MTLGAVPGLVAIRLSPQNTSNIDVKLILTENTIDGLEIYHYARQSTTTIAQLLSSLVHLRMLAIPI